MRELTDHQRQRHQSIIKYLELACASTGVGDYVRAAGHADKAHRLLVDQYVDLLEGARTKERP